MTETIFILKHLLMKKKSVSSKKGTFLIQGKRAGAWAPLGVYLCTCLVVYILYIVVYIYSSSIYIIHSSITPSPSVMQPRCSTSQRQRRWRPTQWRGRPTWWCRTPCRRHTSTTTSTRWGPSACSTAAASMRRQTACASTRWWRWCPTTSGATRTARRWSGCGWGSLHP